MTDTLPAPIARYFSGKNARDFDSAASGFAPDAVVEDERRDHVGPAEIRAWMAQTAADYDDIAEVETVTARGDTVEVLARVSGTFPGSPARLRFRFTLAGDQITRLEISA